MTNAATLARAAAARLSAAHPALPIAVEKALAAGAPEQFGPTGDAANLAAVLVAAAGVAWTIYSADGPAIDAESLARRVRIELRDRGVEEARINAVVDIVVDEAVKAGR